MRGIVITGTQSGCGKTTVAIGILAALRKRGLSVQPFKAGPDFIDAGLHRLVAGRPSRNLDQWMCGQDYVLECFRRHAADVDIAVVEGVMGMYDGDFSTAGLARLLHVPVILVVDAYGMAQSAGAVVQGFADFEPRVSDRGPRFGGVIFNRVASESHYQRLKNSVRDAPVLGYLPRESNFEIPHRHLGLTVAEENPLGNENIERLAATILRHIDMDVILRNAELGAQDADRSERMGRKREQRGRPFKLAVAYDKAFSFYYEDNLDMLRDAGAEIVRFSPLAAPAIPAHADAVYLGGGYPEIHAAALSRNTSLLGSIRAWVDAGKPMYAECGGLMYLSRGIHDGNGNFYSMAGAFPFETRMTKKPRLGYREILLREDCIWGNKGEKCRGHEFHYSEIADRTQTMEDRGQTAIYAVTDTAGEHVRTEGFRWKNTLASYVHIHFGSNCRIAEHFAGFIRGDGTA